METTFYNLRDGLSPITPKLRTEFVHETSHLSLLKMTQLLVPKSPCLKQHSEISGRLKHPFSLTPIDRYSLGKVMFKIPVGYDFTLARYAE